MYRVSERSAGCLKGVGWWYKRSAGDVKGVRGV